MRRPMIVMLVALAIIAGWFLRVAAEMPPWGALGVPASALVLSVLVGLIDRYIDKTVRDQVNQVATDTETTLSAVDRG